MAGFESRPGSAESFTRAGARCSRARADVDVDVSLSLSLLLWHGVSTESETERRAQVTPREAAPVHRGGARDARGRFTVGIYTHSVWMSKE